MTAAAHAARPFVGVLRDEQQRTKGKKMGLDMYVFATKEGLPAPVDFPAPEAAQLHQWRKHPNLHGWMEELYRAKGGRQDSFNCVNVQLTADDLQELEADIKASNLPSTEGFFFGVSDGTELEDDLAFIAKARAAIAGNLSVFYTSWW
jgi:hypothetical protein